MKNNQTTEQAFEANADICKHFLTEEYKNSGSICDAKTAKRIHAENMIRRCKTIRQALRQQDKLKADYEELLSMAANQMKTIKELTEQQQWRDIESAPKDGTEIWGYWEHLPNKWQGVLTCNKNDEGSELWMGSSSDNINTEPTHWMPLPTPPTEEDKL